MHIKGNQTVVPHIFVMEGALKAINRQEASE